MTAARLTLRGHLGSVDACAISADGSLVASAGKDVAVRVWDARSGVLLWKLETPDVPGSASVDADPVEPGIGAWAAGTDVDTRALGFSADGRFLVHVWSEFVTVWNLAGSAERDPSIREQLACVGWIYSDDDDAWAQACRIDDAEQCIRIWFALPRDRVVWGDFELEDGTLMELGESVERTRQLAFRPDGGAVATIAPDGEVSVRRPRRSERSRSAGIIPLNAHDRSRGLDQPGSVIAVGSTHGIFAQGGDALVRPMATGSLQPGRIALDGVAVACAVARDRPLGVIACAGARAGSVTVWDLERREVLHRLAVADVTDCALSADGSVLVTSSGSQFFGTAGGDGVVQVWGL
jgi:WD40 repeat protein